MLTPKNILTALAVFVVGSLVGVGIFTFTFANGWAYLGQAPETCAQCHVMQDKYDSWKAGSHQNVATCNDCHMPHENVVYKYAVKAENGLRHGLVFTSGTTAENIEITDWNREVTENSCLYCHSDFVDDIHQTRQPGQEQSCIQCHSEVGHM